MEYTCFADERAVANKRTFVFAECVCEKPIQKIVGGSMYEGNS